MEPVIRKIVVTLRNARDWSLAQCFFGFMWLIKLLPADRAIDAMEKLGVFFGMRYPRTKQARENIKLAMPEKTEEEVEQILKGMWANLSRTAAEYAFLDEIFSIDADNPENGRVEVSGSENFEELKNLDGAAICFTAHTGNWEILPVGAAAYGLNVTALFRPPNNRYIGERVLAARHTNMGHLVPSKAGASWALANVMDEGGKVGILVDQFFRRGVLIDFFGAETLANPLIGKLVRQFDCPIYPARTIRLPNGRFRIDIEPKLEIPRNDKGDVDIEVLIQKVNDVVERWIWEYPEQWLWLHRRWRPNKVANWKKSQAAKRARKNTT